MTDFNQFMERLRARASSESEKGSLFEHSMLIALQQLPLYKSQFSEVHLWKDWPLRTTQDLGIDLVASIRPESGGGYCAIQCKFYGDSTTLDKSDIDSFLSESSKQFMDKNNEQVSYRERMIISTKDNWSTHAEWAIEDQQPPVSRIGLADIQEWDIDWGDLLKQKPHLITKPKTIRPYQQQAVTQVTEAFNNGAERGKMIMACGTGKTYTALKISETFVNPGNSVLFLVPSLGLMSQSMKDFAQDATLNHTYLAVCSDKEVCFDIRRYARIKSEEDNVVTVVDVPMPPTTQASDLAPRLSNLPPDRILIVFATYQSIDVIAQAQQAQGQHAFKLIICDEAHRTAGVGSVNKFQERAMFTRIHNSNDIRGHHRLYMTATPKVYSQRSHKKAQQMDDVLLYSMDNPEVYGDTLYEYSFSSAIEQGTLADYVVHIFGMNRQQYEDEVSKIVSDPQVTLEDALKVIGCCKTLDKPPTIDGHTGAPLKRVVAFTNTIKASKTLSSIFNAISDKEVTPLKAKADHVDGSMGSTRRNSKLMWLRDNIEDGHCRVLSNARCLTEGIDVPALDAVIFFSQRKSPVDIVQAVGRVMRKTPGKSVGNIILPVIAPDDTQPEDFLNNDKAYKHVWQVLSALRSHDDRFNALINQVEFNKRLPPQIKVYPPIDDTRQSDAVAQSDGVGDTQSPYRQPADSAGQSAAGGAQSAYQQPDIVELTQQYIDAVIPRLVKQCGDMRYWSHWAKDIESIAQNVIQRIRLLLKEEGRFATEFKKYHQGLCKTINPMVTTDQAMEMLAQHWITHPVFDALFEDYQFSEHNSVSRNTQRIFTALKDKNTQDELEKLESFYRDVANRAKGIDTLAGRQRIMHELYNEFFSTAFKKDAERLGIVYTPEEVIDFILHSANHFLQKYFQRSLGDSNVHILDPFAGTGSFVVRLLGDPELINDDDLSHKYSNEVHFNEIMLLPYYIANVNVEQTYHSRFPQSAYQTYQNGVLCDTFQLYEKNHQPDLGGVLPMNAERAEQQKKTPITVIIGNPPYSAGQRKFSDVNPNLKYDGLDNKIAETYAHYSTARFKNSLYDSYVRALRWATGRIDNEGIIAFITNNSFIDGKAQQGIRHCLYREFSHVYVLNLRGNARVFGEIGRKEGGNIFWQSTRVAVAILILIKQKIKKPCVLHYYAVDDYLSTKEKRQWLKEKKHAQHVDWHVIKPNDESDWLNLRNPTFSRFIPMATDSLKKQTVKQLKSRRRSRGLQVEQSDSSAGIFSLYTLGMISGRDAWLWNFSKEVLADNMRRTIAYYNEEVKRYCSATAPPPPPPRLITDLNSFVHHNATQIKWDRGLLKHLKRKTLAEFDANHIRLGQYRLLCFQYCYYDPHFINTRYQTYRIWPYPTSNNPAICTLALGSSQEFSVWATNVLPDLSIISAAQCFPLYCYDNQGKRHDNISDAVVQYWRHALRANKLSKERLFGYVYAVLHHPKYRQEFAGNLKRELPRMPVLPAWQSFCDIGEQLLNMHLHYDHVKPYELKTAELPLHEPSEQQLAVKRPMHFGGKAGRRDKRILVYNEYLTYNNIPPQAIEYQVSGKSLLEWVMEHSAPTKDKESGLSNTPVMSGKEIHRLLGQAITIGVETTRLMNELSELQVK